MPMLRITRISLLTLAVCAMPPLQSAPAQAQDYPSRPIHLVVSAGVGGANDLVGRLLAPRLSAALGGVPVVVENRVGADGIIGAQYVANANPDGYTLGLPAVSPLALDPYTYKNVPFDPMTDFAGATTVATSPMLFVVNADLPIHSFPELVTYAKANPGTMSFASSGPGGWVGLMLALFASTTDVRVQAVNYTTAVQGLTDLVSGRVNASGNLFSTLSPLVKAGKLRALAVTSNGRLALMPDVPTVKELGYPQLAEGDWYAVVGPKHTPTPVLNKLNAAIRKAVADPDMEKSLSDSGMVPFTQATPAAFSVFLKEQNTRWSGVIKADGIKPQ
jgi:tripartite-type tricarboxylate transporter receptor subunit TctC